jgi:2-C-methyl-D-erythritol 4-phosphate cytidylyltransferase
MISTVIVAAGKGTRMGPGVDKLFLEVGGLPLVAHTWRRFDSVEKIDEIILVVRDGLQSAFEELAQTLKPRRPYRFALGGKERQDSVWNGIEAVSPQTEIVLIQDGARPCTPHELILETIDAARQCGAAVAAQRVTDTIKEADGQGNILRNVDRSRLWAVQTPQTFRLDVIRRALAAVREKNLAITDDTAACELIGQPVRLVESRAPNPKATSPADLPFLEMLLKIGIQPGAGK